MRIYNFFKITFVIFLLFFNFSLQKLYSSPLREAIIEGNLEKVEELVKDGADIEEPSSAGNTPIFIAAAYGHLSIIEFLLKKGAKVAVNTAYTLLYATGRVKHKENKIEEENLRKEVLNILVRENKLNDIFLDALCKDCDKEGNTLSLILDKVLDINKPLSNGKTSIKTAIENYNIAAVKILIGKHAKLVEKDKVGNGLLHLAAVSGPREIARLLIVNGKMKIDEKNNNGETPLLIAAKNKNFEVVELLINNGANPNVQDNIGETPLHKAAKSGEKSIYEFLIKNGVDINYENKDNKKASDYSDYLVTSTGQESLIVMIDGNQEIGDEEGALSIGLRSYLEDLDMPTPTLIFGKHLLKNALRSWYLDEYKIFEFEHNKVEGYLLLPNKYLEKRLKKEDIENIEEHFNTLGFDTSIIKLNHIKNEDELEKAEINALNEYFFNREVVHIFNQILLPRNRFIFLEGHGGGALNYIAGLNLMNAVNLFVILARKNTQILAVRSCYFGGKTMFTIQDYFNADTVRLANLLNSPVLYGRYTPYSMIIVSETVSDLPIRGSDYGFKSKVYIQAFNKFKKQEEKLKTVAAKRDFFSSKLAYLLTAEEYIGIFPLIRFPGKNSKFYPLNICDKVCTIDELVVGKHKIEISGTRKTGTKVQASNIPLIVENKTILALFVPYVSMPLQIKENVPAVISYLPDTSDHLFEEINEITKSSENFIDFIRKFTESIVDRSVRHDFFLIKQLFTMGASVAKLPNAEKIKLPHFLYNVLIERGPLDKFKYIFSTDKESNMDNTYKIDSCWYPRVKTEKLTTEEFAQYHNDIARIYRVAGLESVGTKVQ